jgi:hypothetical protein
MNDEGSSRLADGGWLGEWRRFFGFLARPRLPEAIEPFGRAALGRVAALLSLDWTASACFILLFVAAEKAGLHLPKSVLDVRHPGLPFLLLIALGAPLIEEFIFRFWLRGKPFLIAVALVPWLLIGALLLARAATLGRSGTLTLMSGTGAALALLLVLAWKRPTVPRWYRRAFPFFYWATTIAFALAHLFNYQASVSTLLLLMVVPQFVDGMILGYARVTYGMWANLTLHIARNSVATALVLLAGA